MKKSVDKDPAMQGEGNYSAARRLRKETEEFVKSGKVDAAAHAAAPRNEAEANEIKAAEEVGKAHAKR